MNKGRAQDVNKLGNITGAYLAKSTDPVLMDDQRYRSFTSREESRIQNFLNGFEFEEAITNKIQYCVGEEKLCS